MFYFLQLNYLINFSQRFIGLSVISLSLIFLGLTTNISLSKVKLSPQEQIDLNQGKVILKGQQGEYTGQVLATGNLDSAWSVLTDYENFSNFLPNVASSKVIDTQGNQKIFEQVSIVDLWLFTEQSTLQISAQETQKQKIDFQMVKGDLKNLQGTWQLEQVTDNQILITHTVKVQPKSPTEKPLFFGFYESSLEATLEAISQEITKRSQS